MILFVSILLAFSVNLSFASNILVVVPHPARSHFAVLETLVLELASRGHQVTVVSFFPQKVPVENLTDIGLLDEAPVFFEIIKFDDIKGIGWINNFIWIKNVGQETCRSLLKSRPILDVIKSGKKFDLLIVELFNTDCFLALSKVFSVPFLGFSSCHPFPHHNLRTGNPDSLAFSSNVFLPMSNGMTFLQRVQNVVSSLGMQIAWNSVTEQVIVTEVLGENIDLKSVTTDMSLLLLNTHYSVHGPRPMVPGVIEVGGLHMFPDKPLPSDLEKFLNDSTKDVLLFSMGSVLQSSSFPAEKRQAFMDAFKELPVTVLMKWENDTLPGKPDNVRLSRWLPQRDLLAHRKVVAFMGHGGLLSTSEAVYCGVPMVLIPMFGDQPNNVAHLIVTGAAVKLDYESITKDNVLKALRAVLFDKSYRENAEGLSERYRDRPMSPLDTAVYWTEYVIRHKGAPHLRSAAVDMPWYQLWLLDVIAFIFTILALVLYVSYWVIKRAFSLCISNKPASQARRKQD